MQSSVFIPNPHDYRQKDLKIKKQLKSMDHSNRANPLKSRILQLAPQSDLGSDQWKSGIFDVDNLDEVFYW